MTYEDINVGDVLYDEGNSKIEPSYLLVVWKNNKDKNVGCRVGYKGDKTPGYKIDVGQNIIIDVNSIRNFNLDDPKDPDSLGYTWCLRDKERADKWQRVIQLSDETIHLFWVIEGYTGNYLELTNSDNPRQLVINLNSIPEDMKESHTRLVELEHEVEAAKQKWLSTRDEFVDEFYPELKKSGTTSRSIEV